MGDINFRRTYFLNGVFEDVKERAYQSLGNYSKNPNLIRFNDRDKSVTFSSERLIPVASTRRPRVLLLFSNPHPHSVHQGMFLSPNTKKQENLFWLVMDNAGWLVVAKEDRKPAQLSEICLNVKYEGPFELIFYCYYAFPTNYPEEICKIFGKEYFKHVIEPEACDEFRKIIVEASVDAVVTFNKGIFNSISQDRTAAYIKSLLDGELIQSVVTGVDRTVPTFLTFPTGWRYHTEYLKFRRASLDRIRAALGIELKERKNC